MKTREELEAIRDYGPSGSKQETRAVVDSHLLLLSKFESVVRLCQEAKSDTTEIRWVRQFADDILKLVGDTDF